jgi:hypothetical protein
MSKRCSAFTVDRLMLFLCHPLGECSVVSKDDQLTMTINSERGDADMVRISCLQGEVISYILMRWVGDLTIKHPGGMGPGVVITNSAIALLASRATRLMSLEVCISSV